MNRRTAIQAFFAGLAAPLAWMRPAKAAIPHAEELHAIEIPLKFDTSLFRKQLRSMVDLDYIPDVQGVLGKTYFKAGVEPSISSAGLRCYFDGEDVHNRTTEADAVGGWIRMYDVDGNGHRIPRQRTHYGRVEFGEPKSHEVRTAHFSTFKGMTIEAW